MKLLLKILPFILLGSFLSAQVYIPYRVGDKFGISDENGKLLVPAKFDKITIGNNNDFIGYNFEENAVKTSYILKDKVIITNSDFTDFRFDQPFIVGIKVNDPDNFRFFNDQRSEQTQQLFNEKGEKLLNGIYNTIAALEDDAKPSNNDEVLLLLYSTTTKYSVILYSKKKKSIIKTYIENSRDVDLDYKNFPQSLIVTYFSQNLSENKLSLTFQDGKIISEKVEKVERLTNNSQNVMLGTSNSSSFSPPPPPSFPRGGNQSENKPEILPENAVAEVKYAENFPYTTKQRDVDILSIKIKKLDPKFAYLKRENNKVGYFLVDKNIYSVPTKYDEIYLTEGHGVFQSAMILKSDNKYEIVVTSNRKEEFKTAKFEMFPLFDKRDYGKPGFQLIKLFDKDNKFFCYASKEGKLYYSK